MNAEKWYEAAVKGASVNAVAQKSGIAQTTLNRQVRTGKITPETIVAVAVAYGRDPIDGLITSGLITTEQIRSHGVRAALADATDAEIADEVWKRLNDGREHATFDEAVGPAQLHPVPDLPEDAAALEGEDPDTDNEQ